MSYVICHDDSVAWPGHNLGLAHLALLTMEYISYKDDASGHDDASDHDDASTVTETSRLFHSAQ